MVSPFAPPLPAMSPRSEGSTNGSPDDRLRKVGSRLFETVCRRFRESGVKTVRTMLARDDGLNMVFFRSQGMMGGTFIQLEMPLD